MGSRCGCSQRRRTKQELRSLIDRPTATHSHGGSAGPYGVGTTCWPQTPYILTQPPARSMWITFLGSWNGVSIPHTQRCATTQHSVPQVSGAVAPTAIRWFQLCRSGSSVQEESIMVKQLFPLGISGCSVGQALDRPNSPVQMRQ